MSMPSIAIVEASSLSLTAWNTNTVSGRFLSGARVTRWRIGIAHLENCPHCAPDDKGYAGVHLAEHIDGPGVSLELFSDPDKFLNKSFCPWPSTPLESPTGFLCAIEKPL